MIIGGFAVAGIILGACAAGGTFVASLYNIAVSRRHLAETKKLAASIEDVKHALAKKARPKARRRR